MLRRKGLPSLQSLSVFESAARHLSFTRAAEEFHSTQSAISQKVRGLEEELGVQLFTRIYRGVELTPEGHRLFAAVQKGFNELDKGVMAIQQYSHKPSINVMTDFAVAALWLLPRLAEFRHHYPDIDIRVTTSETQSYVNDTTIDVAIIFGDGDFPNAQSTLLFQEEVFPVCSPSLLHVAAKTLSLNDLTNMPLLRLSTNDNHLWLNWRQLFAALDCVGLENGESSKTVTARDPVMTFNNYALLIQTAVAGQGVALGWSTLIDELLANGMLVALKQFSVKTDKAYFIVEPNRGKDNQSKKQFVEWLTQSSLTTSSLNHII